MKKPVPEDFCLTTEEYERVRAHPMPWEFQRGLFTFAIAVIVGIFAYLPERDAATAIGVGWLVFLAVGIASYPLFQRLVWRHPLYSKAKLYTDALQVYQQTLEEYWMSLKGVLFEDKLGRLYRKLGYHVEMTSVSNDKGIDLILKKDGKSIIVQCKGHKNPVGPSVARELYGTLVAHKYLADSAVLACPSGFTKGVRMFVVGKNIQLVSAAELIEMAESVGEQ